MEDKITINLLNREDLDPKLYDIIYELRDKFEIKGWIEVKIKDEDRKCPSHFCGGSSPILSIDLNSGRKRIRDYVKCENELIIKRSGLEKLNPNKHPDELKTIIAHELSHIFNKDQMVWGTVLFFIFIGFMCLVYLFYLVISLNVIPAFFVVIIAILCCIAFLFTAGNLYYRFRRENETRCDSDAVNFTENPEALIRALEILSVKPTNKKDTLWIKVRRCWYNIFGGTHPPLPERIKYIKSLMGKSEN